MRCPFCGHLEDKVIDSRAARANEAIRRRRQCLECSERFTTYECIEEVFPRIIKSDGSRADYDRQKLMRGLRLACSKRPISTEQLEVVATNVERRLLKQTAKEVTTTWVGSCVTDELRDLDPVAYIRFASVYRGFEDIQAFLTEFQKLDAPDSD